MNMPPRSAFEAVEGVLADYFDGLYHSDTQRLRRVFHPRAVYATATPEDGPLILGMDDYYALVDRRPSPASLGQPRRDRVLAIDFPAPTMALARLACSIAPRHFVDLLTLIRVDDGWRVISKVFHYETEAEPGAAWC